MQENKTLNRTLTNANILPTNQANPNINRIEELKKNMFIDPASKNQLLDQIRKTGNFNISKQTPPWYIILPASRSKKLWDTLLFLLTIYNIIILPIDVGWNLECFTENQGKLYKDLYLTSTVIYFIDIGISSITAYIDEKNRYIYNIEMILTNYVKTWFFLDIICSLPFDRMLTFKQSDCFQPYIAQSKLLMMLYLIRACKVGKFFDILERDFSRLAIYIRFTKLFGFIIFFSHLVGNLFVGNSPTFSSKVFAICQNFPTNSPEQMSCQKNVMQTRFSSIYFYSVYFGLISSFGNDFIVQNNFEIVVMMCVTVVTTVTNASIYGNAAVMLNSVGFGVSPILRAKIDVMKEFMVFMKFDERFIDQIEEYHVNIWFKARNLMYKNNFLGDMSISLQRMLLLEQWKNTFFNSSKFLAITSDKLILDMIPMLKPKIFMNGDTIITEGDSATEIYFIPKTGVCQVKIGGTFVNQMTDGDYFGEIAVFLRSNRRTATVVSLKDSDFLLLEGKQFEKLLMDFPEDYEIIRKSATTRLLDSIKLYPSSLFAKLVPNNNIKDYMLRKIIYLNNNEEDAITSNKKKRNLIDLSVFNHKIENITETIKRADSELGNLYKLIEG